MIVLFLTGIVSVILLRTVKRDFSRYDREEENLDDFVSIIIIIFYYFKSKKKKGEIRHFIFMLV